MRPGDALKAEFPALFADAFDVSPPPGWLALVRALSGEIAERWPDVVVHQVKEKFGGLRFYVGNAPQECHAAISVAEATSRRTCQRCGAESAEIRGGGWLRTLCGECVK